MASNKGDWLRRLADKPVVLLAAYYLILLAAGVVLNRVAPTLVALSTQESGEDAGVGQLLSGEISSPEAADATESLVGMFAAFLLMAPVAWMYYLSRRKRGYQQSLMHTLIILPIVVAGVVILVKNSIALAFSLGGIVGAIAFRNRLQDTKDAVHVFVAIGVGLACGVQGLTIGFVLSLFYNAVNVALWMTDIGRTPAALAGPPAQARIDALQAAKPNRSEPLVSQIDSLLLKSMSPEQLAVLVKRADKRRRSIADDAEIPEAENGKGKRWVRIRLVAPEIVLAERQAYAEPVLDQMLKTWELESSTNENGRGVAQFRGRLKKKYAAGALTSELESALGDKFEKVEVVEA